MMGCAARAHPIIIVDIILVFPYAICSFFLKGRHDMIDAYSPTELRQRLTPVFDQYNVKRAILFGSYAKGTADEKAM